MLAARRVLVLLTAVVVVGCGDADDAAPDRSTDPPPVTSAGPASDTVGPVTTSSQDPGTSEPSPPTFTAASTQPELLGSTSPPAAPGTPAPVGEGASPNVTTAVADLAVRTGAEPGRILVVSEDNVTWRDSSIGCPEPGMNYLQSLVDGVRVVLELDGVRHEYHAGGSRPIFYCEHPQPPGD